MKKDIERELREAVIKNYLARWAGRFGVPASHGIGFKLIDQTVSGNSVIFSYEISLVKQNDLAQLSLTNFIWEGHLDKNEAEKIFLLLLDRGILIRRHGAYYFNLRFIRITSRQVRSTLRELDQSRLVSKVASRFSLKINGKFSHPKTIEHILAILRKSVLSVYKTTLKITLLGGSSFSKSYVFRLLETAGSYNVVKVDTTPVTWKQYSKDLKNQRNVAQRLGPEIETLVPGITFALAGVKYLQTNLKYRQLFAFQGNLSPLEQDRLFGDRMIQMADHDENLRNFLKIGDRYGYFMPFLEEGILQDVLNEIHGYKEMPGSVALRIDHDGEKRIAADLKLLQQNRINILREQYPDAAPEMFVCMEKVFSQNSPDGVTGFCEALQKEIIPENQATVCETYKKTINEALRDTYLEAPRTREYLGRTFAGLLKLFALLRRKEIAIHDLKAGNIFITANFENHGILDLLDFETAIIYATPFRTSRIPQPRLGGTPSRGTPSLWFDNDILQTFYGELKRPLYLPDLHAIIEIIYSAVTREPLFTKGKEILLDLFRVIRGELELDYFRMKMASHSRQEAESTYFLESTVISEETSLLDESACDMLEVYTIVNSIFWDNVFLEFKQRIARHKYLLEQITITIPEEFARVMKDEIKLNCRLLETQLRNSSHFREALEKELAQQNDLLQAPLAEITADRLLHLLFITVSLFMNRISPE